MTGIPSLERLRAMTNPAGTKPFRIGILIGPGFIPMDAVGVHTVLGLMPGAEIHFLWKSHDLVEGFASWWTRPTTTFAACPAELDVFAVPMLAPEVQNDPEVIAFVRLQARKAKYVIGVCSGVVLLGAAGFLEGKRVTASYGARRVLPELGVAEVVADSSGTVVDGNLYTAGPGVGSFEAALLVAQAAFGRAAAEFAELVIEYDPHPPFGTGAPNRVRPEHLSRLDALLTDLVAQLRSGAVPAFNTSRTT